MHTSHGHSSTELMNWDVVVPQSFGILTLKKAEVESHCSLYSNIEEFVL